jgi:hypothetical protein
VPVAVPDVRTAPDSLEPEPDPVPVAAPVAAVVGAAVDAGVTVADARQAFWQFSKLRLSVAVPLPLGHSEIHSMVLFCWP